LSRSSHITSAADSSLWTVLEGRSGDEYAQDGGEREPAMGCDGESVREVSLVGDLGRRAREHRVAGAA